ncbi:MULTISPECIES: hypothetical protein [Aerosakkonema]|uniref:hypothetical protein n=1 Tax=Aerosakkonema TaxID=1246629 RepID=UPI0035B71A0A
MKFQQFIEQSYVILKQDYLKTVVNPSDLEILHQNIAFFREAMRKFFERPDRERDLFKSGDYVFRSSGYLAGYWPVGVYDDIYEAKKFPLEYYNSKNLYSGERNTFFVPENGVNSESLPGVENLPHNQGYDIAQFINRYINSPLLEELKSYLEPNSHLSCILQIKPTYYREKVILEMHRDKSFIQSIIGPTSNLKIQPEGVTEPQMITLDIGEILVYTGFQFQTYFKNVDVLAKVKPLAHGVIAEEKRMSIVVSTILNS